MGKTVSYKEYRTPVRDFFGNRVGSRVTRRYS
jgi:hypothetical protein